MHKAAMDLRIGVVVCLLCYFVVASSLTGMDNITYPPAFLRSLTDHWQPCEGVGTDCVCQGSTANCSDKNGLRSIPRLAANVTTLLFYGHRPPLRSSSFQDDFFHNVTNITKLFIGGSFYFLAKAKALKSLRSLRVLCLESVKVGKQKLEVVDYIPTVRELYFSSVVLWRADEGASLTSIPGQNKSNSELTVLYIRKAHPKNRKVEMLYFEEFFLLQHLKTLIIEDTLVRQPEYIVENLASSIQQLALRGIELTSVPDALGLGDDIFTRVTLELTHLMLDRNNIMYMPNSTSEHYPHLIHLSLQYNNLPEINGNEFSAIRFPKLKYLSLKHAGMFNRIPAKAFPTPVLEILDISYNERLDFASDSVSENAFGGCTNLRSLNLEGNMLQNLNSYKFQRMFAKLKHLRVLNLANTQLSSINGNTFAFMTCATEINLGSNKISIVPDGAFDDLANLTVLKLDNNAITTISQTTFSPSLRNRLQTLNLSHNSFQCTCSLLWFRKWLVSNPGLFDLHNPYTRYDCHNLPGTGVATFFLNEQQCLLSHASYVFTVVCTAVLICTLTVAILLYRYRWHIRLALYEAFRRGPQAGWKDRRPEEFQYDLFICYDSDNIDWVWEQLKPTLEDGMGLRLCIHQRNFKPGKNITENIEDCLQVSKRVLVVFSPSFAESQWCNFELQLCLSHVIDNHDVVVLVMLEHVPSRDMSSAMLALLKTTTYIEWGEGDGVRELFWRRMTLELTDILPALRQ